MRFRSFKVSKHLIGSKVNNSNSIGFAMGQNSTQIWKKKCIGLEDVAYRAFPVGTRIHIQITLATSSCFS